MGGEIEVGRRRSRLDLRRKKKGKVKCGVVDVVTHVHIKWSCQKNHHIRGALGPSVPQGLVTSVAHMP